MAVLVWTDRRYETGVDRGVVYVEGQPAVVWNGLTSVTESFSGGDKSEYYFDGVKYADLVGTKTYQADISAYSAPKELLSCLGEKNLRAGVVVTNQPKSRFNFSYRTLLDTGYKIHLVYNALLTRTSSTYSTQGDNPEATIFEWKLDAVPPDFDYAEPTAHLIIDSTKSSAPDLVTFENFIYGTAIVDPIFPSQQAVYDLFKF